MPSYEVRYLNSDGELALIHSTHHENDDAVDRAALRMLVGSGLAHYEIWREERETALAEEESPGTSRTMLKSTLRAD
jgi:hypothetical protein